MKVNIPRFDFAMVPKSISRDQRLSLKSRGMILTMLSLPDNWDYTINGLVKILKEGKDSVRSCINEMEDLGYLTRSRIHSEDGRIIGMEYNLILQSTDNQPMSENPTEVNPTKVNPTQYNTTTIEDSTNKLNYIPSNQKNDSQATDPISSKKPKTKEDFINEFKKYDNRIIEICRKFFNTLPDKIRMKVTPNSKLEWCDTLEKCHRLDGFEYSRMEEIVLAIREDSFWKDNFFTITKLRTKNNKAGTTHLLMWDQKVEKSQDNQSKFSWRTTSN